MSQRLLGRALMRLLPGVTALAPSASAEEQLGLKPSS